MQIDKKIDWRDWIAEREGARLLYSTLTGEHQVCIIRKGDPVLRLPTKRGRENHLFCILGLLHEVHLDLR